MNFYQAFEDRHHDSRKKKKLHLSIYLPFVILLQKVYPTCDALDLRCGQGEWLELLTELGINCKGFEFDEDKLRVCKSLGFNADSGNVVTYMKGLPSASLSIITGFHIAEYLQHNELQELVSEAFRILKPGGLIILETLNAEHLTKNTDNFCLETTPLKLIPSDLLLFLMEHNGGLRSKILRMHEPKHLYSSNSLSLSDVLSGVGPSYSVVAQKEAQEEVSTLFDPIFSKETGLKLKDLSTQYDRVLNTRLSKIDQYLYSINNQLFSINYSSLNSDTQCQNSDFYRTFEEHHRGSRDAIKSRLKVYLPFIQALQQIYPNCNAVDLGCGRGEWLELMVDVGVNAKGVDLDEGMSRACKGRGYLVEQENAITYLKNLDSESQMIVTGFHLVEHIHFSDLQELTKEAMRVLKPGGLLILESPNSENIMVGTNSFYLDPTHLKPISSQLLLFLVEYYGFARTKVLRLQETKNISESITPRILDVLGGVSPDYSVIAQKHAANELLQNFDLVFSKEYGATLEHLGTHYDQLINQRLIELESQNQNLANKLAELQGQLFSFAKLNRQAKAKLSVIISTLWKYFKKILKPIIIFVFRTIDRPSLRKNLKPTFSYIFRKTVNRPVFKKPILKLLNNNPGIKRRLRIFAVNQGLLADNITPAYSTNATNTLNRTKYIYNAKIINDPNNANVSFLPEYTNYILAELNIATARQKKGGNQ